MVKGVSKRVIVVRTPDDSLFSEAIFILNENALCGNARDSDSVLREACAVADDFVLRNCAEEKQRRFGGPASDEQSHSPYRNDFDLSHIPELRNKKII